MKQSFRYYEDLERVCPPRRLLVEEDGRMLVVWDDMEGYNHPVPATKLDIDRCIRYLEHEASRFACSAKVVRDLRRGDQ